MKIRVLVTGSRDWDDTTVIREALCDVAGVERRFVSGSTLSEGVAPEHHVTLVHGDARGADRLAALVATQLGFFVEAHPADWTRHKKQAGYIRNVAMIQSRPDICLAFIRNGSPGATHCAEQAERAGIPVQRYTVDDAKEATA